MQPYQQATEEIERQGNLPLKTAKTIGSLAGSAAAAYLGGGTINRVLPFLSKYIPDDLVKKGLSKIDPRYGKFIDKALKHGKSIDEIKDFIGGKINESAEKKSSNENRSILEQYSPELFQFIDAEIKGGRSPLEAGALAQLQGKFKKSIAQMEKDHNAPFSSIIESTFGQGLESKRKEGLQKFNEKVRQPGLVEEETERFKNYYGQKSQGDKALMDALQKILQM